MLISNEVIEFGWVIVAVIFCACAEESKSSGLMSVHKVNMNNDMDPTLINS